MMSRARQLPIVDIGGVKFYLDLRMNQFRDVDDFSNSISLDHLYELPSGKFLLAFNKATKNVFEGTEEAFKANPDCVVVKLPSYNTMDPWGMIWMAYDRGYSSLEETESRAKKVLHRYEIKDGLILQLKPKPLLEKKRIKHSKGNKL